MTAITTTNMNMIMGIMIMRDNITRTILTAMTGNIITIITPPLRISKRFRMKSPAFPCRI